MLRFKPGSDPPAADYFLAKRLPRRFYARDTHIVAQALLGKTLVRMHHGNMMSGRIVEVEAYVGEDDLACHASRGRTLRTNIMYGEAGHAYIYLIYGMYYCLNIVTDKKGFPAAVLIRAVEPLTGKGSGTLSLGFLTPSSSGVKETPLSTLTSGPGKLTRALNITAALNREDLTTSPHLFVADDGYRVSKKEIVAAPRIGVAYAGACALYPWRYYVKDSAFVSKK